MRKFDWNPLFWRLQFKEEIKNTSSKCKGLDSLLRWVNPSERRMVHSHHKVFNLGRWDYKSSRKERGRKTSEIAWWPWEIKQKLCEIVHRLHQWQPYARGQESATDREDARIWVSKEDNY